MPDDTPASQGAQPGGGPQQRPPAAGEQGAAARRGGGSGDTAAGTEPATGDPQALREALEAKNKEAETWKTRFADTQKDRDRVKQQLDEIEDIFDLDMLREEAKKIREAEAAGQAQGQPGAPGQGVTGTPGAFGPQQAGAATQQGYQQMPQGQPQMPQGAPQAQQVNLIAAMLNQAYNGALQQTMSHPAATQAVGNVIASLRQQIPNLPAGAIPQHWRYLDPMAHTAPGNQPQGQGGQPVTIEDLRREITEADRRGRQFDSRLRELQGQLPDGFLDEQVAFPDPVELPEQQRRQLRDFVGQKMTRREAVDVLHETTGQMQPEQLLRLADPEGVKAAEEQRIRQEVIRDIGREQSAAGAPRAGAFGLPPSIQQEAQGVTPNTPGRQRANAQLDAIGLRHGEQGPLPRYER